MIKILLFIPFGPFSWKLNILIVIIDKYFNFLINKLKYIKKVILHQQNVNIKLLLQTQSDEFEKNDFLEIGLDIPLRK